MKKNICILVVIAAILAGCNVNSKADIGSENAVADVKVAKGNESTEETSANTSAVNADNSISQGAIKDGVCLELVSDIDMTPIHYLTLRKRDTVNDKIIKLENDNFQFDISAQNVVSYSIDDVGNLVIELNTLGESSPINMTLDGCKYSYTPPLVSQKSITLNQDISYGNYTATIDKGEIYPNSIVLYLSNPNEKEAFQEAFILVDNDTENETVPYVILTDTGMVLTYPGKNLGEKDNITIRIGKRENYIFQDIVLK
jgi:lipoprotein